MYLGYQILYLEVWRRINFWVTSNTKHETQSRSTQLTVGVGTDHCRLSTKYKLAPQVTYHPLDIICNMGHQYFFVSGGGVGVVPN